MSTASSARMPDGARIRWWRDGPEGAPALVRVHGGPGLPDYLAPVARLVDGVASVHRYDQRGTGGSDRDDAGRLGRHLDDLAALLDRWAISRVRLVGHSYGTDLAVRFADAHPDRVDRMLLVAGPFVGDWRDAYAAERRARMTAAELTRRDELSETGRRTDGEETELLELSWFPDHADPERRRDWAAEGALSRRPVNWGMNRALGDEARADPLEDHLGVLRGPLAGRVELVAGEHDPRPLSALIRLSDELGLPLSVVDGAGHEPWRERPERMRDLLRAFAIGA